MNRAGPPRPLAPVLDERRRRYLVGRHAELEFVRALLDGSTSDVRVLALHGPGGIGKSTLLHAFASEARSRNLPVLHLDARDLAPDPAQIYALTISAAHEPANQGTHRGPLLLVDDYDRTPGLEARLRTEVLPGLPDSSLTVLAGRRPPGVDWRTDPAWTDLLRVIALRNLDPAAGREYLVRREVPPSRHGEALALTHGHPLALSLVADVLAESVDAPLEHVPAGIMTELLPRILDEIPGPAHRTALQVATIARLTTEDLLRDVVGGAASSELFDWLLHSSMMQITPDGVSPHDLIRELLDAELRWRDPEAYRTVFRQVQERTSALVRRTSGRRQQRGIADLKYMFRKLRAALSPISWKDWGDHWPDRATPADHVEVLDLVRAAEGQQSAVIAQRWLEHQPTACHVIRAEDGTVRGVVMVLDLSSADPEVRAADPLTTAAWSHVGTFSPQRPGERVLHTRFIVDRDSYQDPSPTFNAVPLITLHLHLATAHLAWDLLSISEPDRWEQYFLAAQMPRAPGRDVQFAGRTFGLFGHDFRRVPWEQMARQWTERALSDDALLVPPEPTEPELLVLAYDEFDTAVRQALRDLHRVDLLARSPLASSRLTLAQGEPGPDDDGGGGGDADDDDDGHGAGSNASPDDDAGQRLARVLRDAITALAADGAHASAARALRATYLTRLRTQEAAAAALGLPYSTFRRHLRSGTDQVVDELWRRELGQD